MAVLKGWAISPGYGSGTAFLYRALRGPSPPNRAIETGEVEKELARLAGAIDRSVFELEQVQQRVLDELGESESHILSAQTALLLDQGFVTGIRRKIEQDRVNVELALELAVSTLATMVEKVENAYLRERVQDLYDVQRRLLKHLGFGPRVQLEKLPPATIVVARELYPSDTLNMDRAHAVGLVLEHCGLTSHAAILARSLGIPTVRIAGDVFELVADGASVLVDGERGEINVNPGCNETKDFESDRRRYDKRVCSVGVPKERGCTTKDGEVIHLLANIGRSEEAEQVLLHNLDGVGLFRTEYLFLSEERRPGLKKQKATYRRVLQQLPEHPVFFRTLDLGGDKSPSFAIAQNIGNPKFGLRGLRLSLQEGNLFRVQLQAIMEAGAERNNVAILLPMVGCASEVREAIDVIRDVSAKQNTRLPLVGAMIETPAAVFEAHEILNLVDFAALGTNDLVQFTMAMERRTMETLRDDAIFQPAILRAIALVLERAQQLKKPISVCGEAAGNPAAACLLVGLGVRQLSMSPVRTPLVRETISSLTLNDHRELAQKALQAGSREEVGALMKAL